MVSLGRFCFHWSSGRSHSKPFRGNHFSGSKLKSLRRRAGGKAFGCKPAKFEFLKLSTKKNGTPILKNKKLNQISVFALNLAGQRGPQFLPNNVPTCRAILGSASIRPHSTGSSTNCSFNPSHHHEPETFRSNVNLTC